MDGTISCTSEQGKGSEFVCRFRFPVAGPESLEEQGGAGDRELKAEGKRILLVEDNALNREISREILEADGFAVEDADDGDVAVEKRHVFCTSTNIVSLWQSRGSTISSQSQRSAI